MNSVHKDFQLNGNSFSNQEELLEFSKTISKEAFSFLVDWFSNEHSIQVKTSGSTGTPKGILLKKEYMKNSALATGVFFELYEKTTALCCLPINFIAGKMMLVRAMTLGWHIDVTEPSSNPLENTEKKYDFSAMVPLQLSNSLDKIYLVDALIVGGGVVSPELEKSIQSISTKVYATYGMTETITHISVKPLNINSNGVERPYYKLLPNISISIDDRYCLVIDAPKVSDEKVITNDVVEIVSNEEFIWKGRYDNVINSGGVKMYPEEIERKLSAYINSRFFVAGIPDEKLGEKLILIIEGEKRKMRSLKNILNKFEVPKEICFVPQFIEADTGKIQRKRTLKYLHSK